MLTKFKRVIKTEIYLRTMLKLCTDAPLLWNCLLKIIIKSTCLG